MPAYDDIEVGSALPSQTFAIRRQDLVMYCGASGDGNVIHWNERIAKAVGLPDVIAHGMYTMAVVGRVATDWAGDPGALVGYRVRFTKPVPVPDDDVGAALTVAGSVEEKLPGGRVVVGLTATLADGATVLSAARAVVQLPPAADRG